MGNPNPKKSRVEMVKMVEKRIRGKKSELRGRSRGKRCLQRIRKRRIPCDLAA
jgi:hypothetical protein